MRGAQPDAECPRCSAVYPPSFDGRLVTCKKCGLVFAPHDVQRPAHHGALATRAADDDFEHPIMEHLGDGVSLETTAEHFGVRSRAAFGPSLVLLGFATLTATFSPFTALGALMAAIALLVRRSALTIEGGQVDLHPQPSFYIRRSRFPLTRIAGFSIVPSAMHATRPLFDIVAEVEDGKRLRLVRAVRQRTAELIQLRLAELRVAQAPRKAP